MRRRPRTLSRQRSLGITCTADAGSATAEYAVLLPAAALVLAATVNIAVIGIHQVRMEEAAAAAARQLARGEDTSTITATVHTMAGADTSVGTSTSGEWASVQLSKAAPGPASWLLGFQLEAEGHAPQQWTVHP
ncbi:TadE family type IV pilus minor pilin [Citricoccus sp. NR2]|uniref:TadE family type IV pilus minor pilin n=1 Tax=Citricoccus sp. NR2 TaxID=3004095 RepID=UPI0022DE9097|nr:TadE family type IV pilus minor pilin [Citricoccus sp. NR2]WBL20457.1 TadE family type IV pilus minor pilin [Citricoccus sp. NR2]